ncbi:MAG: chromosome segregation protein SMC [Blautia hansenii]|nr:chromosome segregation protein SMC [Blautia hansenii]MEE0657364.1 chromosome segregation protein SMC [Blautia hansenii]
MYLKSIEVQGFKSFANKITFEFHNGITGIVGPNGSGKSNVGDAVRWVLGEQSAKQLRGGNMQDVIFSGTETRKPLGFAYVAITLDNSDHKLPIDYQEVTIARRLYRSGESEYLLNGTSCRLKDVNELFYDTGIGKEGYSIIGQGQIDKILSGKPEERRELFDEAAGIVKFKRRKNTAIKKLEEEQQNLTRVNDILSELTRQLAPLEKQAETAKVYLKKKEALKQLDIQMFLVEMARIREQLKAVEEKYEIAQSDLEETCKSFDVTKTEYENLEKELEILETEIQKSREQSTQKTLEKQNLENQIHLLQEQIHSAKQNETQYQERAVALDADIDKRKKEEQGYLEEQSQLEEKAAEFSRVQSQAQEAFKEIAIEIHNLEEAIESGKNEIIEILNQRASIKGKLQRYDTMMEQISIRKVALNQRNLTLRSEAAQLDASEEQYKVQKQEIEETIEKLIRQGNRCEDQIKKYQAEISRATQQLENEKTAYHREASRLESLKNITERYDGYGNSIRRVMEQKKNVSGIKGVVADLLKVEKNYETAIETALGGSIQNIVTDNENTAKGMIEFLKKNKYGRATFLPLTSMKNKKTFNNPAALKEPGVIGVASDLVQVEAEYEGLANYLLGRTLVVDHIDHGIAIAKKYQYTIRMVTIEGESLNPGGSLTGGAFKNNSNLLGRRREIDELHENVEKLKLNIEKLQAALEEYRNKRNHFRDEAGRIQESLQEQYIQENTVQMNLNSMSDKRAEIKQGYENLKRENAELEKQTKEIEENSQSIQLEMEASASQESALEKSINEKQEELESRKKQETDISKELEKSQLEGAGITSRKGFIQENLRRIKEELESLTNQKEALFAGMEEGKEEALKKETEIVKIRQEIELAAKEEEEDREKLQEALLKKEKMTQEHKAFFSKRDELSARMNLLDKESYRLLGQKEKLEENQETQVNYMWEEYEITYSQALIDMPDELQERAEIKSAISNMRSEIRQLGNVNVNAIEEYKELSERHTFMKTQHDDLVQAEETLQGIINELDTGMRRQFEEKFGQIRIEFDKAFKELFGGGKGTLELDEEEDILEAGIRIISQPPGKKLQNMMQLSGGEKALTAIALLFAIQNLKPSPFCLLDEIEAALDDSNVTRYAKYLHKLTKNTQFIIITHRRGTMAAADRLYGITMQEKGVSTLVSVDLIENDLDK